MSCDSTASGRYLYDFFKRHLSDRSITELTNMYADRNMHPVTRVAALDLAIDRGGAGVARVIEGPAPVEGFAPNCAMDSCALRAEVARDAARGLQEGLPPMGYIKPEE